VPQTDPITITWNGQCTFVVSRDLSSGTIIIHVVEIHDPNLPIYFVAFRELRRR